MPKETVASYPIFHALVSYVMLHSHTHSGRELLAEDEAKSPSEAAAEELRRVRTRKGWNQQQLADRLEELGAPIDQATISKIEKNRRRMTLDEVFAFAYALGVSPRALMLPRAYGSEVSVTPATTLTTEQTLDWLRGFYYAQGRDLSDAEVSATEAFFFEEGPEYDGLAWRRFPELTRLRNVAPLPIMMAMTARATPPDEEPEEFLEFARADLERIQEVVRAAHRELDREEKRLKARHPSVPEKKRTPAKRKPGKRKPAKRKGQR
jgi:transcriptional regulator with XRE-family HTH domain